ncbi:MAG: oligosaccharide flippase family protein [candidate division KSB1 bacterium]|nr:oligosaccharide flippase family protein [candidate division KSB1 bacterium]MDZ7272498.1 oligosaccharide flippase family protein [candidate division KSB1 bacterium]MDZ7284478.1 oligosaccharide flippase family protein [candidate division KSB1 bacterium]MDZ7297126.1 oligosaccharide flippase family protein [candidate division KSB1 bacterium]MDZ7306574.1 oligosaccharide flippase family protein [candidate division KSB1 bacterium]
MSFLRKSSLTLASRIAIAVFGFLISALTARFLGPEGKGFYAVLTLLPMLLAQVISLGLTNANIYLLGQKRAELRPAAENALIFSLAAGAALLGLYWLLRPWADALLFKDIAPSLTALAVWAAPFHLLFLIFNYLALADDDIGGFNLPNLSRQVLLLCGFLLLLWGHGLHVTSAMLWWSAVNALVALHACRRIYQRARFGLRWHSRLFRETLGYGLKTYPGIVLYLLSWRLDFILCNSLLDATAVGFYSTATVLAEILWFVPQTLSVVLLPQASRLSELEARELTSRVCRFTLWLTLLAALLLGLLADHIVTLVFGPAFVPAVPALWLLLPGVVMYALSNLLTSHLVGRGHPRENNQALALAFFANLGINLCTIPRFGILGAALASSLSYTLATLHLLRAYQRLNGASLAEIILPRRADLHLLENLKSSLIRE